MHYEIVKKDLFTRKVATLMALMAIGAFAFLARFAFGLGATTNLSDNYPWGLWIVFDLVWIALAGGAFVTAGIVYVFMAEDFHPLARPAVWMGLLSYSFVMVTLLADLGLPWHFWQLGVQRPEHSAMYEVSWCIALYVTVLGLEFAPTVFERFGWDKLRDLWRDLSPIYTVLALAFFVFLMSHQIWMAGLALVVFAVVAFLTRDSFKRIGVPVILIVAAVTFSTMHQSSLGSLFLLMPDKLSHLWWSPIMSLLFFLSAVVSGIALVMLMDLMVSYFFDRPFHWAMLGKMGQVLAGALGVYYTLRIADVIIRGEIGLAFSGRDGAQFLIEIIAGGIIPLVLLSTQKLRGNKSLLALSAVLALGGVIFNRLNVVLLGMNLPGTLPGGSVSTYYPSMIEWAIVISLIAALFFFFGLGVKLLPILPKAEESR
ncbi:MAG TPA: NrfD/PsrC family molybdoenzyme membrane anchor subunit [bacterium]|nr:NrfD/PsrC family molybdoenzyme membrane anchor subunit [bacterium]